MSYFPTQKALEDAKYDFADAVLRVWSNLPVEVTSEVMQQIEFRAEVLDIGEEELRLRIYAALHHNRSETEDYRLDFAELVLSAWHRIAALGSSSAIFKSIRDLALLERKDEMDAMMTADLLISECGDLSQANQNARKRHVAKEMEANRRKSEKREHQRNQSRLSFERDQRDLQKLRQGSHTS